MRPITRRSQKQGYSGVNGSFGTPSTEVTMDQILKAWKEIQDQADREELRSEIERVMRKR